MSDSESIIPEGNCTPEELIAIAQETTNNLLPEKSKERYRLIYKKFNEWREQNNATSFSERVLLAYFNCLKKDKTYSPSTLWSIYSMLAKTIQLNDNVDISKHKKLLSFLKKENVGHQPKKSLVLQQEHLQKFLSEAPDLVYLFHKVVMALGVSGGLRRQEIHNITTDDIQRRGENLILVEIPKTKTNDPKSFAISGFFFDIFEKYDQIRKKNTSITTKSYLVNYTNGKCTKQAVGINKIGSVPKAVAEYLQLENPELYTGHCLRRTGTSLLVSAGADISEVKRFGGWKSSSVAEGYIVESLANKRRISARINNEIDSNLKKPRIETVTSENSSEHTNFIAEMDEPMENFENAAGTSNMQNISSKNENVIPVLECSGKNDVMQAASSSTVPMVNNPLKIWMLLQKWNHFQQLHQKTIP